MLKPILLSVCLALPAGLAFAQNDTGAPGSQDGTGDMPMTRSQMSQEGGSGEAPGQIRPGGGHGEMMMRHHPGMRAHKGGDEKGFKLEFGEDRSLRVRCGDEPMADCLEAVRPLIESLEAAAER